MLGVPDAQLGDGKRAIIPLQNRFFQPQFQMLVEPTIHERPAYRIKIVRELHQGIGHHAIFCAPQTIVLLEFRQALGGHILRPIAGANQRERSRRHQRRQFNAARTGP